MNTSVVLLNLLRIADNGFRKFDFHTPNHFSKSSCSSLLARMRLSGCSFLNLA